MLDRTARIRKSPAVIDAPMAQGHVLLDPSGDYVGLDEIGAEIWRLFDTPASPAELAAALAAYFAAPAEAIETDVLAFLETLAGRNLIEPAS